MLPIILGNPRCSSIRSRRWRSAGVGLLRYLSSNKFIIASTKYSKYNWVVVSPSRRYSSTVSTAVPYVIHPKLGKDNSIGLKGYDLAKREKWWIEWWHKRCGRSLNSTRPQLLLDMTHKSNKGRVFNRFLIWRTSPTKLEIVYLEETQQEVFYKEKRR